MICEECKKEIPDNIKICPFCGSQLSKKTDSEKPSPPEKARFDPNDKSGKQFAEELKSKIKKYYYIKKDYKEAMNYIDLYLSMIGVDAEVIDYQQKILSEKEPVSTEKKTEKDQVDQQYSKVEEMTTQEDLFELEVENEDPLSEGHPELDGHQEPSETIPDEKSWVTEDEEEILELEDDLSPIYELEPETESVEKLPGEKPEEPDQRKWEPDGDTDQDDQLLVLGPDQEILELEENTIEPESTDFEQPVSEDEKNHLGEFEIEISEQERKAENEFMESNIPMLNLEEEISQVPEKKSEEVTEFETQMDSPIVASEPAESVQTILDDLKEKKKKVFRWLFIGLSVIAFIILIIVLYILSTRSTGKDRNQSPPPPAQGTVKKESPKTIDSAQEKKFSEYLARASIYYQNGDLKNAEEMVRLAREMGTTEELNDLEKKILEKNKEQEIIEKIDEPENVENDNSAEAAFLRAINSSNIVLCQEFLEKYPSGKHAFEIRKRIEELQKQERINLEQQLNQKLGLYFRQRLRTFFVPLTEQEIKEMIKRIDQSTNQIENRLIDGDPVTIDYTFGLMWHHWDKKMNFKKAKWWANRRYAGYVDWRLPTVEEALTLSEKIVRNVVNKSVDPYEIWTGDTNSRDALQSWVYSPFSREINPIPEDQYKYLWSVRVMEKKKD